MILASVATAWLAARGAPVVAAAVALALPVAVAVLLRPSRGFLLAILLTLLVPATVAVVTPQLSVSRLAAVAVLGAMVIATARSGSARLARHPLDATVAAVAAGALLSWAVIDTHPPDSLQHAINYLVPLVLYAGARRFAGANGDAVCWTVLLGGALAALTLYYEFLVTSAPLFVDRTSYYWSASGDFIFRPGGVFGSPPGAGTVLAMTTLAGLPLFRQPGHRLLVASAVAVSAGALCLTFTRGSVIAFAVGAVVYLTLVRPRWWGRLAYAAAAAVFVVVLVVLPRVADTSWYQSGVVRPGNFAARESFWSESLPLVTSSRQHVLVGHGINSLIVGRSYFPGSVDPDIMKVPSLSERGPHNQYVRTLLEQGLIGLGLLLVWLLGATAVGVRFVRRNKNGLRAHTAAATAALLSLLVVGFVNDVLRHAPSAAIAALLSGCIVTWATRPGAPSA